MRLIKVTTPEDMPKTMFTAEELSTFIRKSIVVCVVVTIINGVAIFVTTCVFKSENQGLKAEITANRNSMTTLNSTVTQDIAADQAWRNQLGISNPKLVTPKVIQPTPVPLPTEKPEGVVVVGKPVTPPPSVIVLPPPTPIVKREVIVKRIPTRSRPTPTPFKFLQWGPKSKSTR